MLQFLLRLQDPAARVMVVLILVHVLAVMLSTVQGTGAAFGAFLLHTQWACLGAFAGDWLVRGWLIARRRLDYPTSPIRACWRYFTGSLALLDALAVLPVAWSLLQPGDWAPLSLLRMLPLLKLARHSPAISTLGAVFYRERRALLAAATIMLTLLVFLSAVMYAVERSEQPEAFGSIPAAMWWGIATLTTVGYGDVVPYTPLGRVIGAMVTVVGFGMFGLPAGILATGFAEEMKRRDFVSAWNLVAKVPFFDHLPAQRIAEIVGQLKTRHANQGEVIVRAGDQAHSMFFLADGSVDIDVGGRNVQLNQGDFFGEIALLRRAERNATVTAATKCLLLELDVADFDRILAANADLLQAVQDVARRRQESVVTPSDRVQERICAHVVVLGRWSAPLLRPVHLAPDRSGHDIRDLEAQRPRLVGQPCLRLIRKVLGIGQARLAARQDVEPGRLVLAHHDDHAEHGATAVVEGRLAHAARGIDGKGIAATREERQTVARIAFLVFRRQRQDLGRDVEGRSQWSVGRVAAEEFAQDGIEMHAVAQTPNPLRPVCRAKAAETVAVGLGVKEIEALLQGEQRAFVAGLDGVAAQHIEERRFLRRRIPGREPAPACGGDRAASSRAEDPPPARGQALNHLGLPTTVLVRAEETVCQVRGPPEELFPADLDDLGNAAEAEPDIDDGRVPGLTRRRPQCRRVRWISRLWPGRAAGVAARAPWPASSGSTPASSGSEPASSGSSLSLSGSRPASHGSKPASRRSEHASRGSWLASSGSKAASSGRRPAPASPRPCAPASCARSRARRPRLGTERNHRRTRPARRRAVACAA